jgi:hypothetical protein
MAIQVGLSGTTVKTVAAAGSTTQVKEVIVGTPIRRVTSGAFSINNLDGVDTTGAVNGSLLIFSTTNNKFVASKDLEEQNINGGSY